jgi:hypothetical protein
VRQKHYLSKIFILLISFFSVLSCKGNNSISSEISSEAPTSETSEQTTSEEDSSKYEIINGSFETGDLTGWETIKGDAFLDTDIVSFDNVNPNVSL